MRLQRKLALLLLVTLSLLFGANQAIGGTTPPQTTHTLSPTTPDGQDDWYVTPVEVTLSATDLESGVASINWRLNGGGWQQKTFSPSPNLAPNASFETVGGSYGIEDWEFIGLGSSVGSQDTSESYFDAASAKIVAVENGWSSWRNQLNYIVAEPWEHYTVSVWVKTQSVIGVGAYFRVFAVTDGGPVQIGASPIAPLGDNDWLLLTKEIIVSTDEAYGIFIDLGLEGVGTVWYDGAAAFRSTSDVSSKFTLSTNGDNLLEYYSVDQQGNTEAPVKSTNIKVDTIAPAPWQDFDAVEAGNDHTLIASVSVNDATSGLDGSATQFQYSVDAGANWGYYQDQLDCSSPWIVDEWLSNLDLGTFVDGDNTMRMTTPEVDYCNSNWAVCKMLTFKTADIAGNQSSKTICINGTWFKTDGGGDVGSRGIISMGTTAPEDNSDGALIAGGSVISNFSSSSFSVSDYLMPPKPTYLDWQFDFGAPTTTDVFPSIDGVYIVNSDFTFAANTLPGDVDTALFSNVVFINGTLTINRDFTFGDDSATLFIVSGDVLVDKNVNQISGFYLIDGQFNSAYNGGSNIAELEVFGGVVADTIVLPRSLSGRQNESDPAEIFHFLPSYFLLLEQFFQRGAMTWREVPV